MPSTELGTKPQRARAGSIATKAAPLAGMKPQSPLMTAVSGKSAAAQPRGGIAGALGGDSLGSQVGINDGLEDAIHGQQTKSRQWQMGVEPFQHPAKTQSPLAAAVSGRPALAAPAAPQAVMPPAATPQLPNRLSLSDVMNRRDSASDAAAGQATTARLMENPNGRWFGGAQINPNPEQYPGRSTFIDPARPAPTQADTDEATARFQAAAKRAADRGLGYFDSSTGRFIGRDPKNGTGTPSPLAAAVMGDAAGQKQALARGRVSPPGVEPDRFAPAPNRGYLPEAADKSSISPQAVNDLYMTSTRSAAPVNDVLKMRDGQPVNPAGQPISAAPTMQGGTASPLQAAVLGRPSYEDKLDARRERLTENAMQHNEARRFRMGELTPDERLQFADPRGAMMGKAARGQAELAREEMNLRRALGMGNIEVARAGNEARNRAGQQEVAGNVLGAIPQLVESGAITPEQGQQAAARAMQQLQGGQSPLQRAVSGEPPRTPEGLPPRQREELMQTPPEQREDYLVGKGYSRGEAAMIAAKANGESTGPGFWESPAGKGIGGFASVFGAPFHAALAPPLPEPAMPSKFPTLAEAMDDPNDMPAQRRAKEFFRKPKAKPGAFSGWPFYQES